MAEIMKPGNFMYKCRRCGKVYARRRHKDAAYYLAKAVDECKSSDYVHAPRLVVVHICSESDGAYGVADLIGVEEVKD